MENFMKLPCKHCPFRNDVKPYLHPDRAYEIASVSQNPYSSFACHKTTESDDDGECHETEQSKECAGMLTMRAQAGENIPDGFEPSWTMCYIDPFEMYQAYDIEWSKKIWKKIKSRR